MHVSVGGDTCWSTKPRALPTGRPPGLVVRLVTAAQSRLLCSVRAQLVEQVPRELA